MWSVALEKSVVWKTGKSGLSKERPLAVTPVNT
jgi:hypothetical protein